MKYGASQQCGADFLYYSGPVCVTKTGGVKNRQTGNVRGFFCKTAKTAYLSAKMPGANALRGQYEADDEI